LNRQDDQQHAVLQFQPIKDGWQIAYAIRFP